ncbi:Uncharacterised protein [Zhongshania aliphaticivorans]|uniref:Uncharacterized protein n=1 Tax=Zhongshania aliphaticivorans TaxID=1470434 RepID=A0A5S9Q208_9GAMM|nr:hypothetical protein [Zhongshania aliphaticivorans]CAA0093607.1 Uncharacterised protein [Zhongshania aliphaticivorans]CAA0111599.1 Uncharacterised protein [Zhongshania aliphaticivorans]
MRAHVQHLILLTLAWLLIAIGIVFLLSPIPVGVFFIAVGLSVLISTSDAVAAKVSRFRRRHVKFNDSLHSIENKLGNRLKFVSAAMRKTRPSIEDGH